MGEAIAPRERSHGSWALAAGYGLSVTAAKTSRPMKLPKAKTYALEMVKGIRPGKVYS